MPFRVFLPLLQASKIRFFPDQPLPIPGVRLLAW
jgi:hypothetical protein